MPRYCSVPNCKSNKPGSDYVTVFRFPKIKEKLDVWVRKVPHDFQVKHDSVVCAKHFLKEHILMEDIIKKKDGTIVKYPRTIPKLHEDACIFPDCPDRLSKPPTARTSTLERLEKMRRFDEEILAEFEEKDKIVSFERRISNPASTISDFLLSNNVLLHKCENCVSFLFFNCNCLPFLNRFLKIDKSLSPTFFLGNEQIISSEITGFSDFSKVLTRWSELENLLTYLKFYSRQENVCPKISNIQNALKYLELHVENDCDAENVENIKFVMEQLHLTEMSKHGRRYSSDLLVVAFCIYMKSRSCYSYLQDSKIFILPTLRHLKLVSSGLKVRPGIDTDENFYYLQARSNNMSEKERIVNLMIDEIYVKSSISYKSQGLTGFTGNKGMQQASTVQVFMYSSILSKNKEVVALVPVTNSNGEDLYSMVLKVLLLLKNTGFIVFSPKKVLDAEKKLRFKKCSVVEVSKIWKY